VVHYTNILIVYALNIQPKGQSKKGNPDKLAKDEEKQNKNTTQYVLDTTIHKQTQITRNSEGKDNTIGQHKKLKR
jgi:hypothetical protein